MQIMLCFQSGGRGRTRTYEGVSQRIYSPPPLPLGTLSLEGRYLKGLNALGNSLIIASSFINAESFD
jgi:hypothetical protein